MTERQNGNRLDDGAAKLDEGAKKLDEVAGKLHEGAVALHEVALQMKGDTNGSPAPRGEVSAEGASSEANATTLQRARTHADQLGRALRDSGRRASLFIRRRPLTVLATVGAATAFVEAPFAFGLLAGVAGAALLVSEPGAEVREALVTKGQLMRARAREAWEGNRQRSPQPASLA